MLAVIAALIPVFLLIVTGFALRRWLIADDAHWVGLERLLYYVMFPALLIDIAARAPTSPRCRCSPSAARCSPPCC